MTKTTDILPFADGSTEKLRAGDTVFHSMSGETWVILADTGRMIAWAGWPCGMENRANCTPRDRCSDARHQSLMADIRNGQHPLTQIILRENGGIQ